MWKVYMHKNPNNGKCYIGITCQSLKKRWNGGKGYKECTLFNKAIDKYGWDSFEHRLLFDNLSELEAKMIEEDLIYYYKKIGKSYNITNGGDSGWAGINLSDEHKNKIAKALIGNKNGLGYKMTDEAKQKISSANIGKHHSDKTKSILSKKAKDRGYFKETNSITKIKSVAKYSLSGELIETYKSIKEAAESNNIKPDTLSHYLSGRGKTCGGFLWKKTID